MPATCLNLTVGVEYDSLTTGTGREACVVRRIPLCGQRACP